MYIAEQFNFLPSRILEYGSFLNTRKYFFSNLSKEISRTEDLTHPAYSSDNKNSDKAYCSTTCSANLNSSEKKKEEKKHDEWKIY